MTTLDEFNALVKESFDLDSEIKSLENNTIKPLKARLAAADQKILAHLEALDVPNFKSSYGMVSRKKNWSCTVPKTIEDKKALEGWLKAKGEDVYYAYVGVNSNSIKALYNAERELALKNGDMDFSVPGVGAPKLMESITRRKK